MICSIHGSKESTLDLPIESSQFVVFDTELTGLSARYDQIISIGAIVVSNLQIVPYRSFYSIIKPKGEAISQATFVHRITPEDLVDAPSLEDVLPKFLEFCGNSIIVGHQLEIDLPFLRKACRKVLLPMMPNPFIDTIRLSQCCRKNLKEVDATKSVEQISYNLGSISRRLGLPLFPLHDALGDALQVAYLLLKLISILRNEGLSSCRELCVIGSPSWLQSCCFRWGMKNV
jgi:DNA polymerase-3 subunit epsilon